MRDSWRGFGNTTAVVILLTGAETSLLHLLTALLAGSPHTAPLGWLWLWVLGLVAFLLPRALSGTSPTVYVLTIAAAILLTCSLAVHASSFSGVSSLDPTWIRAAWQALVSDGGATLGGTPLAIVAVLGLWWRQIGRETPGTDAAGAVFRWGPLLVAVLTFAGLAQWQGTAGGVSLLTTRTAIFFLLTLLALGYTQWIETPLRAGSGRLGSVVGWLTTSVLPLLLAAVVAVVLSALLFGTLAPAARVIADVVAAIVFLGIVVVSTALRALTWPLAWLIAAILSLLPDIPFRRPPPPNPDENADAWRDAIQQRMLEVPDWIVWSVSLGALLLVLYVLSRYRPRRESLAGVPVARESVWELPDLRRGLRDLLRRPVREHDPLDEMLRDPTWQHTAQVRRAYRDAAALLEEHGRGREAAQTAQEHARSQRSAAYRELAAVYAQARYSTIPAPPDMARRAMDLRNLLVAELKRDNALG